MLFLFDEEIIEIEIMNSNLCPVIGPTLTIKATIDFFSDSTVTISFEFSQFHKSLIRFLL